MYLFALIYMYLIVSYYFKIINTIKQLYALLRVTNVKGNAGQDQLVNNGFIFTFYLK